MAYYNSGLKYSTVPHFGKLNPTSLKGYTPILAFWGAATFAGIFVFTENWPLFQDTFYKKIPVLGQHWIKEVDPQDQPQ